MATVFRQKGMRIPNPEDLEWIEKICDTPAEMLASRDPTGACFDGAWQTVGGKGALRAEVQKLIT